MKRRKRFLTLLLMMTAIICMSLNVSAAAKINKTKAFVIKGKTLQLKVTGKTNKPKWSSNKKTVATVSSTGLVKARKKGTAIISAVLQKKTFKCKITVEDPKINKTTASIKEGKTTTLKIKGTNQKIKWSSKNKGIAKVSSKGVVTGKSVGKAKIIGTVGGKEFICKITVTENEQNDNGSSTGSSNASSSVSDEVLIDNDDNNSNNNTSAGMVWIPKSGSKYHSTSTCSGMKNPSYVTLSEAISSGYTACSKCW